MARAAGAQARLRLLRALDGSLEGCAERDGQGRSATRAVRACSHRDSPKRDRQRERAQELTSDPPRALERDGRLHLKRPDAPRGAVGGRGEHVRRHRARLCHRRPGPQLVHLAARVLVRAIHLLAGPSQSKLSSACGTRRTFPHPAVCSAPGDVTARALVAHKAAPMHQPSRTADSAGVSVEAGGCVTRTAGAGRPGRAPACRAPRPRTCAASRRSRAAGARWSRCAAPCAWSPHCTSAARSHTCAARPLARSQAMVCSASRLLGPPC